MTSALPNTLQRFAEESLLELEQAKEKSRVAIGFYCLYSPVEIAVAANAITLPLCGTRNEPISIAEEVLPRNLCPLIKSSFGFAISDSCPFFRFSDIIIGDTTCDGKKKMFELLSRYKPTYVLQLPQSQTSAMAHSLWRHELDRFKGIVEEKTGITITDERLHSAIRLMNRKRMARKAVMDLNKANPAPLSGSLLLETLFKTSFLADKEKALTMMEEIIARAKEDAFSTSAAAPSRRKRILLTGVPVGIGSDKIINIVEQCGADIVALENCSGYKQAFSIDENKDPMTALTEQYLATPCSVMSPNAGRFELLDEMIKDFSIDGVVDLTWQACHTYNIEAISIEEHIRKHFDLPTLHLETDYAKSDTEQLRVRVEAYLEML